MFLTIFLHKTVSITMQTAEKKTTPSNIQPQNQAQPMQPPSVHVLASTIVKKANSTAEMPSMIQNDDSLNQTDENDELMEEMETDETQYEDEAMDANEEEEETGEKKIDDNNNNNNDETGDLRDIFPELRDTETE